jgi:hypothetical protein
MTRRLSFTEAQCLSAMHNVPSYDEPATINHGAQVLIAKGMSVKDAEKVARGLFDEFLRYYGPL